MKKGKRIFLLIVSIITFLVLTPALIFYAKGYRYDFKTGQFSKIGIILLYFWPSNAEVYLDGKLVGKNSPKRIRNLNPKEYDVEIKKDTYTSWKKRLEVKPGLVTIARGISLFYSSLKVSPLISEDADLFTMSKNIDRVAYIKTEQTDRENPGIFIYSVKENSSNKIFPKETDPRKKDYLELFKSEPKQILWSPNQETVLFEFNTPDNENRIVLYNVKNEKSTYLPDVYGFSVERPTWGIKDSSELFWLTNNILYRFDIEQNSLSQSLDTNVFGFEVVNDNIYYVTQTPIGSTQNIPEKQNKENISVWKMNTDGSKKEQLSIDIPITSPSKSTFDLFVSQENQIAILNKDHGELYIVNQQENEQSVSLIATDVSKGSWSESTDGQVELFLYSNKYEILTYNPQTKTNETITRRSIPITNISWYNDFRYIVFQTDADLQIAELDPHGTRDIYKITDLSSARTEYVISPNGEKLFFSNRSIQHPDLMKLQFYEVKIR